MIDKIMLESSINQKGFLQQQLQLPSLVRETLQRKDYFKLDKLLASFLGEGGILYDAISPYIHIRKTEHIIAIRNGVDDEDGIWHDDGSRELAFTLSLTLDLEQLEGGVLLFRKKGQSSQISKIQTPSYGVITIFKTGVDGYEHCLQRVTRGVRIICAGWIN